MASLSLKHIFKVYDGGVKAVSDFCKNLSFSLARRAAANPQRFA